MSRTPLVHIHYLRPPNQEEVFTQYLLLDAHDVKVTLARNVQHDPPIRIGGEVALEPGSDAVWFTFPGHWHDIGRFHRADGSFTGIYANILTPPQIRDGGRWWTTDLFLDLWLAPSGVLSVLDEDQFTEGVESGVISEWQAKRAREEVEEIQRGFQEGSWPPPVVHEWTLEKARNALSDG